MEIVIDRLMDSEGKGLKCENVSLLPHDTRSHLEYAVIEMIVPPDLNQARVNKCLITLVSRKFVTKDNSTVGWKIYRLRAHAEFA